MSNNTPYSAGANAYHTTAATTDPRALEGQILLKSAQKLEILSNRFKNGEQVPLADTGEVITYNQKLWTLFLNDAMDPGHPLPNEIKSNIASLALFVFKRSKEVLIETTPEKLKILIDINRNIASGLMKQAALPSQPAQEKPARKDTDNFA